jgi:pyruvate-formate lyase-activating enzyme
VLARLRHALAPPAFRGARWTARRLANYYRVRWEEALGRVVLESRPVKLTIEATSACNLRCPACFTGAGAVGRPRGGMPLASYRRLLDELGPYLFEVELHNWGEPLLHEPVVAMVADAHGRGIATTISTNLSFPFDADRAERLVAAGLTVLGVSIDGARQDTYAQYRVGGSLDLVLRNCRLVADAKRRLGSSLRLVWEFHVFAHNAGDVAAARTLADEIGMEFVPSKGWTVGAEWDPNGPWPAFWSPMPPMRCRFLWQHAVVNHDGGVAPCCGTFYREDDMGRLAGSDGAPGAARFMDVWNGESFRHARGLYRRYAAAGDGPQPICYDCPVTKDWDRWTRHRSQGGGLATFAPGYGVNDGFNFFFARRPRRS